jgi:uncharacterized protein YjiS (DUF1127 family)
VSDNEYPDSRDPKPRRVVIRQTIADLTRIADEANQMRQRHPRRDLQRLATLVAELADIVKTTIEER